MATINQYFLYNLCGSIHMDKSLELINMVKHSNYEEILEYVVERYGDFERNQKTIEIPEYSKKVIFEKGGMNNVITCKIFKDGEFVELMGVTKSKTFE